MADFGISRCGCEIWFCFVGAGLPREQVPDVSESVAFSLLENWGFVKLTSETFSGVLLERRRFGASDKNASHTVGTWQNTTKPEEPAY